MLDVYVQVGFIVGLFFFKFGGYDFRFISIVYSILNLGLIMLKYRLIFLFDEVYSFYRKFFGVFFVCIKFGVVVLCREMLFEVYEYYKFEIIGEFLLGGIFQ